MPIKVRKRISKVKKRLFFLLTALLLTLNMHAYQRYAFGLNVNTSVVEFEARANVAPLTSDPVFRNFYADFNYINDNDSLVGIGAFVENVFYNYHPLMFQVGIKSVFTGHGGKDFMALPILFGFKHKVYSGNIPIGTLGAKILYAPSPLAFQDADKYLEYRIEATLQIIENVELYAGYRNIDTDYKGASLNYTDSGYLGFRFIF